MGNHVLSIDAIDNFDLAEIPPNRIVSEIEYIPGQEMKVRVVGKNHRPEKAILYHVNVNIDSETKEAIGQIPRNVRGAVLRAIIEHGLKDYEEYGLDLLNQHAQD